MENGAKVLVVEDENTIALGIKRRLEKLGYIVPDIISTGEEAIQRVNEVKPDLILMDIMLKGDMDGVEAAGKIHSIYDVPIIFLTAYSDEDLLKRAKLTDPYGYIVKPFKENDLRTNVKIALYRHKMDTKK